RIAQPPSAGVRGLTVVPDLSHNPGPIGPRDMWNGKLERVQVVSDKNVKVIQGHGPGFDEHLSRPERGSLDIYVLNLVYAALTRDCYGLHCRSPSIANPQPFVSVHSVSAL